MARYIRIVLIILLVVLCAVFMWQFINMILEHSAIWAACDEHPGFSCDAVPQYLVGGFHFFSFILLTLVLFSRRYFWLMLAVATYLSLHIYGTYARLGTGFFGGDMCPDGHPCFQAIRRASWFDWTATSILTISLFLTFALAVVGMKSKPNSQ